MIASRSVLQKLQQQQQQLLQLQQLQELQHFCRVQKKKQAQLSQLTDKGTWQQVAARIEDLCTTHVRGVSWRRTTLLSMFKNRLGSRSHTGDGGCRLCG